MRQDPSSRLSISVIIPTYNRAALVTQAIDSALNQTRMPDEIIVVDDGSTDETPDVLARYGPPVRVIRQDNEGRSAARNAGLRHASGDLIVFLDSDDLLTPTSIEHRAQIFERSPDIGVVYGDMYLINFNGEYLGVHRQCMPGPRPSGFVLAELALRSFILMPAMIRRSALNDRTFDVTLEQCEDYDLWRRFAPSCRFQFIEEPVAWYRIHDANTLLTQADKIKSVELEIQRRIFAMPEFAALSRCERARAFCYHGTKTGMAGNVAAARHFFARAIGAAPWRPTGYGLLLLSLLSPRLLGSIVLLRRRLTRKDIHTLSGEKDQTLKNRRLYSGSHAPNRTRDAQPAAAGPI